MIRPILENETAKEGAVAVERCIGVSGRNVKMAFSREMIS